MEALQLFFFSKKLNFRTHIIFLKNILLKKKKKFIGEKVGHNYVGIYAKNGKLIPFTSQI